MPIDLMLPALSKMPVTPTTALSLSSASVVAGSSRFTRPCFRSDFSCPGSASESTFNPTASAVFGLTPGPAPAVGRPGDRLMQMQRVPPPGFIPECIEAEDLSAHIDRRLRLIVDPPVRFRKRLAVGQGASPGEKHGLRDQRRRAQCKNP